MRTLVTGGAGYIGSHTVVELINAGEDVVIVDNLSTSSFAVIRRLEEITKKKIPFYKADLLDTRAIEKIFKKHSFDCVLHFAGFKSVSESIENPIRFYHNNVSSTLVLIDAMRNHNVKNIVFSSSCAVYGNPDAFPIREDFPLKGINPYARTKIMQEEILRDLCAADASWNVILLRYFKPMGSHASARIGESYKGAPTNLVPFIMQVAAGKRNAVSVFGDTYPTPDGTGVRDYLHVVDLALGHVRAIRKLRTLNGIGVYNLGTGKGYSVLDVIRAFSIASGKEIPYVIEPQRPGEIAICYADATKAQEGLGWTATRGLDEMCLDAWNWQKNNPNGYE